MPWRIDGRTVLLGLRTWTLRRTLVACAVAVLVGSLIGVATVAIPNPVFARDIPPVWWNAPVLVLMAGLTGMLSATYVRIDSPVRRDRTPGEEPSASDSGHEGGGSSGSRGGRMGILGTVLAWFAVGCRVCDKIALLALGYTGALASRCSPSSRSWRSPSPGMRCCGGCRAWSPAPCRDCGHRYEPCGQRRATPDDDYGRGSGGSTAEGTAPLERQVLEILWDHGPLTVRQVIDQLPTDPAYTTIATVLTNLKRKRYVRSQREGSSTRYVPVTSRADHDAAVMGGVLAASRDRSATISLRGLDVPGGSRSAPGASARAGRGALT